MTAPPLSPEPSEYQLQRTWIAFKRALLSPEPFNPFRWIFRLALAALEDLATYTGFSRRSLVPAVPIFAVTLILLVVLSYFASIRSLIQERWCGTAAGDWCGWMPMHDTMVLYVSSMILFHYVTATFASPGVALANPSPDVWTARAGQGGFWGWNPVLDKDREQERVQLYGPLKAHSPACLTSNKGKAETGSQTAIPYYFPSLEATYCQKCNILRPPRCHHCSHCGRCILQFDHHCLWLNNCIGYNNYRSFVLTLFFLMLGCWYGVAILFWPFYEPLRAQVKEHGWKWMYTNGTGFLDLPPPMTILRLIIAGQLPTKMVIDMVYPLLLGVGAVMSAFLGFHVKYILRAYTTLEYRIVLQQSCVNIFHGFPSSQSGMQNPFDQGWYRNMQQVLGRNLLLVFLPISVKPLPPYSPKEMKQQ